MVPFFGDMSIFRGVNLNAFLFSLRGSLYHHQGSSLMVNKQMSWAICSCQTLVLFFGFLTRNNKDLCLKQILKVIILITRSPLLKPFCWRIFEGNPCVSAASLTHGHRFELFLRHWDKIPPENSGNLSLQICVDAIHIYIFIYLHTHIYIYINIHIYIYISIYKYVCI